MPVEDGVDGADGGAANSRIPAPEALSDLRRAPARILLLEPYDQRLDLHRELIGMPIRPPASIRETIQAAVLVAGVDLVAGLAGNAKLPAEAGHLLAVEQPGNESETFVHNMTLLPGQSLSPAKGESVTYVSGMKCHPSLGKGTGTREFRRRIAELHGRMRV